MTFVGFASSHPPVSPTHGQHSVKTLAMRKRSAEKMIRLCGFLIDGYDSDLDRLMAMQAVHAGCHQEHVIDRLVDRINKLRGTIDHSKLVCDTIDNSTPKE